MLETSKIDEIKRTISELKKAESDAVSLEAEMNMVKKQATEIFKKYNMKGFSDIPVLENKLSELENSLLEHQQQAIAYIEKVNSIKQETESILIG